MKPGNNGNPTRAYGNSMTAASIHSTPSDPLARVCALLNQHGAHYLVVGGHACILHGLIRTTEDVDILVEESEDNYRRVIAALSQLEDGAARELTPKDFQDNVVVKVADEVEVDISRRAWKVSYTDAQKSVCHAKIEGESGSNRKI
ncbi:MAG: hypothetical protein HYV35_02500 [Lentisphaerae bacterium]|nr:hypothetical protein [Lentisphaerota bacterium]